MSNTVGYSWVGLLLGGPLGLLLGVGAGVNEDVATARQGAQQAEANARNAEIERQKTQSETQQHISDNGTDVALAQIHAQEFMMRQASSDRELQRSADLTLTLEKFDTGLQTAKLDYFHSMTAEENHHIERMAEQQSSHSSDIPAPITV